jgi:hypothetical protein
MMPTGPFATSHNRRAKSRYADQRTSPEEGVSAQSIEEEKTMHVVEQRLFFGRPIRQRRADVGASTSRSKRLPGLRAL